MNILENKIGQLISLYNSVLSELNEMTEENFCDRLNNAKNLAISANSAKEDILLNNDPEILKKYKKSLDDLTKQIQLSYDNIIKQKQKQILTVASDLKNLQNKKKIAVYER